MYVFGDVAPLQSIRDRKGNRITVMRANGQTGNITRIASPNGRRVGQYDADRSAASSLEHHRVLTVRLDVDRSDAPALSPPQIDRVLEPFRRDVVDHDNFRHC